MPVQQSFRISPHSWQMANQASFMKSIPTKIHLMQSLVSLLKLLAGDFWAQNIHIISHVSFYSLPSLYNFCCLLPSHVTQYFTFREGIERSSGQFVWHINFLFSSPHSDITAKKQKSALCWMLPESDCWGEGGKRRSSSPIAHSTSN